MVHLWKWISIFWFKPYNSGIYFCCCFIHIFLHFLPRIFFQKWQNKLHLSTKMTKWKKKITCCIFIHNFFIFLWHAKIPEGCDYFFLCWVMTVTSEEKKKTWYYIKCNLNDSNMLSLSFINVSSELAMCFYNQFSRIVNSYYQYYTIFVVKWFE